MRHIESPATHLCCPVHEEEIRQGAAVRILQRPAPSNTTLGTASTKPFALAGTAPPDLAAGTAMAGTSRTRRLALTLINFLRVEHALCLRDDSVSGREADGEPRVA